MVTAEEYRQAAAVDERRMWRLLAMLGGIGIFYGITIASLLKAYGDAFAAWFVQTGGGPGTAFLLVIAILFLFSAPLIGLVWLSGRRARRDPRLRCPHCGSELASLLLLTGNCSSCGKLALAGVAPRVEMVASSSMPFVRNGRPVTDASTVPSAAGLLSLGRSWRPASVKIVKRSFWSIRKTTRLRVNRSPLTSTAH